MELHRDCTCQISVVEGKIKNIKSSLCPVHSELMKSIVPPPAPSGKPVGQNVGQNDVSGQNVEEKVTRTDKKKIENLTDEELQIQVDRTRLKLERLMQEKVERFRKRVGR